MKLKFILIPVFSLFILQSCNNTKETEDLTDEQIASIKNSDEFKALSSTEKELVSMDLKTVEEKQDYVKEKGAEDTWHKTKCITDGRVCCSNCNSNGDPNRCAKTRFGNCSVCGHGKSSHYVTHKDGKVL